MDSSQRDWIAMPDLCDLSSNLAPQRSRSFFISDSGRLEQPFRDLANTLARLIDQATDEYRLARRSLTEFLRPTMPSASSYWHSVTHVETCITAVHRALNMVERLRKLGYRLSDRQPLIPSPRSRFLDVTTKATRQRIREFRDSIHHIDERILDAGPRDESSVSISFMSTKMTLKKMAITYDELSLWIRELHGIIARVNAYREPVDGNSV